MLHQIFERNFSPLQMQNFVESAASLEVLSPSACSLFLSAVWKLCFFYTIRQYWLLIGWQEGHPVFKIPSIVICWCRWVDWCSVWVICTRALRVTIVTTATSIIFCHSNFQNGLTFWYQVTQIVRETGHQTSAAAAATVVMKKSTQRDANTARWL